MTLSVQERRRAESAWRLRVVTALIGALGLTHSVFGQPAATGWPTLSLGWEFRVNLRDSRNLSFAVPPWVFGPDYPSGAYLSTPSPGTSLEPSLLRLTMDSELTPSIRGHVAVHVVDLYARNPTGSSTRVFLREAYVQFGDRHDGVGVKGEPAPLYLLVGKAPRFTRERGRALESFGLWGIAVGWLEQTQVQLGGDVGGSFYWRAHAGVPNPLYMRDTNALAGSPGTSYAAGYGSGFPILYETESRAINAVGTMEYGAGLGFRFGESTHRGIDVLVWGFQRHLGATLDLPDRTVPAELELLRYAGLPVTGTNKRELGANVTARAGRWRLFAQFVDQRLAGLGRNGYEVEVAYRAPLYGLFASGDSPVFNWIQPAMRLSRINNQFGIVGPATFGEAVSLTWDWAKLDIGVRVGIVRGLDLTVEVARHDMILRTGRKLHPDELLATLRFAR